MSRPYFNIHGRRGGRGIRPCLLLPKVVCVALYIGGLATVTIIWISSDYNSIPADDPRRQWLLALVGRLMVFFVVPALLLAMVFGVLLFAQHAPVFMRLRWLQVKLIVLLILIPTGHFWCRAQTRILRDPQTPAYAQQRAARRLSTGLAGTLAGSLLVVLLGRLKPRWGQNSISTFAAMTPKGKMVDADATTTCAQ